MDGVQLPQVYRASGGSVLCTIKSPGIPGTYLIDLRRMKG